MNRNLQALLFGAGVAVVIGFFIRRQAAATLSAINPTNPSNIFAATVNELTGAEERGSSLGSDIFDFFQGLRGIPEFDPNA